MNERTHDAETMDHDRKRAHMRVGLLTDPGVPAELAAELVPDLPAALAAKVHGGTDWDVATEVWEIPLDERDSSRWSRWRGSTASGSGGT
jgi:hypothetical protein